MYKMIRIYDVEEENNEYVSAKYEVIREMEVFQISEEQEEELEKFCIEKNIPYGRYSIVKYENDVPVEATGQFFYHSEEEKAEGLETFLEMQEWNERALTSTALGVDLMLSKESKEYIKKLER